MGESVYKFEEEFAKYCGTKYAISTNSGTSALQISLLALGIKGKKIVVTTPASFIATSNSILFANLRHTFADINLKDYTIDPLEIEKHLGKQTEVIMPVHLYGFPAKMKEIIDIAKEKSLRVIEDACQSHGASLAGKKLGSFGDAGCFSFYPSKNMTVCGDGGMIVTDDDKIRDNARKLRDCGRISRYEHDMLGYTARLNTVNAAIGRFQLKRLDEWNRKRREIARRYHKLLCDLDCIATPPAETASEKPSFYVYVIRSRAREQLRQWLEKAGVQCGVHYPVPIHLQPIYRRLFRYRKGDYPNSEILSETCLSIPMYPTLHTNEIEFVTEKIHAFFRQQ
jgi:perosamine synthetase